MADKSRDPDGCFRFSISIKTLPVLGLVADHFRRTEDAIGGEHRMGCIHDVLNRAELVTLLLVGAFFADSSNGFHDLGNQSVNLTIRHLLVLLTPHPIKRFTPLNSFSQDLHIPSHRPSLSQP